MKIVTKLLSLCLALVLFVTTLMPSAAMANPSLNKEGQVFILSILSNAASSEGGTEEELQELLTERVTRALDKSSIQKYIGDWDVVWGPVVYKPNWAIYATNAMYVAKNGNQYVVAIAGTNPKSILSWLQDLKIRKQKRWPYGERGDLNPKISRGTFNGLNHLLQDMKSSDKTVLEFLQETVKSSDEEIEIIFTGHSLGGALSPTLALAAFDQKSEWAGEKPFKISVYPSAGPTPGNQDFSTYYDSQLGNSTKRIWNDLDIVPYAWNRTTLAQIPRLYKPHIQPDLFVEVSVFLAQLAALGKNYTQIISNETELNGEVDEATPSCNSSFSTSTSTVDEELSQVIEELEDQILKDPELRELYLSNDTKNTSSLDPELKQSLEELVREFNTFMKQAIYQHTNEYAELLGAKEPYCIISTQTGGKLFAAPSPSEFETLAFKLLKEQPQILLQ